MKRLKSALATAGVDCLALVPGANLFYLTGLSFHLMERPTIGFFSVQGQPAMLVPALEASKVAAGPAPLDWQIFPYTDQEGPDEACARLCQALGLNDQRLAVERLTMRVLELDMIRRDAPGVEIGEAEAIMAELRMRKDEAELTHMRRAVEIAQQALALTLPIIQVGRTEKEIAADLLVHMLRLGTEKLPFEPIVVSGPNSALPHAGPSDRPLQAGDLLTIDFGATAGGYVSDITRTFAVGGPLDPELAQVYQIVQAANAAGRAAAGPGVPCQEVDRAARRVIVEAGYAEFFIHRTGHGLGLEGHESPYIVEGNRLPLEPGMTFTVEPGIYLPGRGGVRVEDDVVITPDGCQSLTTWERSLKTVG
jgi:Xaa-Pro dipeptidase